MNLEGVRVLDLTRLLPGPYATQLLADAGADVIKVEEAKMGDYARYTPPMTDDGIGSLFDAINRGKRSVSLNLKTDAGTEAFYRLAESADVIFEQFRPGVAERLGVDYESVTEYNSDVIYCSLTGYGQNGPDSQRVGHDLNYVATAGLLDMTRSDPESSPEIPGFPIGDMSGGLFSAYAIVGALLSRELGNEDGEYLDISMTDVALSFSQSVSHEAIAGEEPRPGETSLTGGLPWYDIYETADGRYVTLAALEPEFWETFCETVGREDLIDAHGLGGGDDLEAVRTELTDLFASQTAAEWEEQLGDEETMFARVNRIDEALHHPQIEARDIVLDPEDARRRVAAPVRRAETDEAVPGHGEHTESVLREAGFDEDALAELREAGAID